jgi:hypothetical protein
MKATILKAAVCGLFLTMNTGCGAFLGGYPSGGWFDTTSKPHPMDQAWVHGPGHSDDKTGEACSTGYLGLIAMGDASLAAAKKAGGITDVHTVDFRNFSILGVIYQQGCTVVHGK